MRWFKKIFGLLTPVEKKQEKLKQLRRRAAVAERKGNLRLAGNIYHSIELLETEIVEMFSERR